MQATNIQKLQPANTVNGVDVDVLGGTVAAVAADRKLGKSRFRAHNQWAGGAVNRTTVAGFYAAAEERTHPVPYTMVADEPTLLAGGDTAPNPVEHLLHALASCLTTSMVAHAAVRGIRIDRLEAKLEGDIDLAGFFGLDSRTPKGYSEIRVNFRVDTPEQDLERVSKLAEFSPVYNTVRHGTNVVLGFERF